MPPITKRQIMEIFEALPDDATFFVEDNQGWSQVIVHVDSQGTKVTFYTEIDLDSE